MLQSFHKSERLKSKVAFKELVTSGKVVKKFPFILLWKIASQKQESPIRIAFSVSKKRFLYAVDRNHIKRKINEVYRRKKSIWYKRLKNKYNILLIFTAAEKMTSVAIENKLILLFERFISDVEKSH